MLLAAITRSCPGGLLGITCGDINLFVLCENKAGEVTLYLRLTRNRSRQETKAAVRSNPSLRIETDIRYQMVR